MSESATLMESTTLIESTKCPACRTDLLMETSARYKVKTFEFARGIKIDCPEIHCEIKNVWTKRDKFDKIKEYLYQKLSCRPVYRQNLMECLTHRCKLNESLAYDLIEQIKVDFGVYEHDNQIMFAQGIAKSLSLFNPKYLIMPFEAKVIAGDLPPKKEN